MTVDEKKELVTVIMYCYMYLFTYIDFHGGNYGIKTLELNMQHFTGLSGHICLSVPHDAGWHYSLCTLFSINCT